MCVDVSGVYTSVELFHFPVPGPVSKLSYKAISSESVNITWSAPMEPNGDIEGYNVSYREIEGNAGDDFELGPDNFHKIIESLSELFLVCGCTRYYYYVQCTKSEEW